MRSSPRLHIADRHALAVARAAGAEIVVVEAVGRRGSAPTAVSEALAAGAGRALRLVDPALETADANATGFALASVFDRLDVDLILFGSDASSEGVVDVPACIAHHMSATYLEGALQLKAAESAFADNPSGTDAGTRGLPFVEVTVAAGAWIRRLQVPLNAVVGIVADAPFEVSARPASSSQVHVNQTRIEVLSLAELNMDSSLIPGRDDGRGVVDPSTRPLVTLHSVAAVAALLRR
jgi:electron transfer flavoprotein beta subunit